MTNEYRIEVIRNGLTYVFSYRSKSSACYHTATGRYAHGDLRAPTLALLFERNGVWHDDKLAEGVAFKREGDLVCFASESEAGVWHRCNGQCSCKAGTKGIPCWHRATKKLIALIDAAAPAAAPAPAATPVLIGVKPAFTPLSDAERAARREQAKREIAELFG